MKRNEATPLQAARQIKRSFTFQKVAQALDRSELASVLNSYMEATHCLTSTGSFPLPIVPGWV